MIDPSMLLCPSQGRRTPTSSRAHPALGSVHATQALESRERHQAQEDAPRMIALRDRIINRINPSFADLTAGIPTP